MKTVSEESIKVYEIKKSEFICHTSYVSSEQEAQAYIQKIKSMHPTANHNCSAYLIDAIERASDDGEPSGTAGMPMLEVMKHHDLNYVCCVVTRYFGGIKLGAGGLIRAYAKSVGEGIKASNLFELIPAYKLQVEADYSDTKVLEYYLKKQNIKDYEVEYNMKVKYKLAIEKEMYEQFCSDINQINHLINVKIEEEIKISRGVENEK